MWGSVMVFGLGKVLLGCGVSRLCWLFPQKTSVVCVIQRIDLIIQYSAVEINLIFTGSGCQLVYVTRSEADKNKRRIDNNCDMTKIETKTFCSRTFSDHQTALFLILIVQFLIFEFYFDFSKLMSPLLIAVLVWRYSLVVLLVYEVWVVTSTEPTDPVLSGKVQSNTVSSQKLLFCILCDNLVLKTSHHCFRCGRCAHDFDHHCKYLNVCIGGTNYISFLRLLVTFIIYDCLIIVLTILQEWSISTISYLLVSLTLFGLVVALLVFHIYLNWCLGVSTIDYLMPQLHPKNVDQKQRKLGEEVENVFTVSEGGIQTTTSRQE